MLRGLAAALVALALAAGPAAASSFVHPVRIQNDARGFAGPVAAGDQLVWVKGKRDGQIVVQALAPGGEVRTVERIDRPRVEWNEFLLRGAPVRLAVVAQGFREVPVGIDTVYCTARTGPLAGPLRPFEPGNACPGYCTPALWLSGGLTAHADGPTHDCPEAVDVTGTAGGTPVELTFEGVRAFDLNDPWALVQREWTDRPEVVDVRTGAVRWRPPRMYGQRVDEDGSVIGSVYTGPEYIRRVAYSTPDDPTVHLLPVTWNFYPLDIVPRRGLYAFATTHRVKVMDRAGAIRQMRVPRDPASLAFGPLGVSWRSWSCAVVEIVTWDLADDPPRLPERCDFATPRDRELPLTYDEDYHGEHYARPRLRCARSSVHGCAGLWKLVRRPQGRRVEVAESGFQLAPRSSTPSSGALTIVRNLPERRRFRATLEIYASGRETPHSFPVDVIRPELDQ